VGIAPRVFRVQLEFRRLRDVRGLPIYRRVGLCVKFVRHPRTQDALGLRLAQGFLHRHDSGAGGKERYLARLQLEFR
jgi:hypothetical protein